ncbi:hypothetical protein ES705_43305 [subsurface metagenome]
MDKGTAKKDDEDSMKKTSEEANKISQQLIILCMDSVALAAACKALAAQ